MLVLFVCVCLFDGLFARRVGDIAGVIFVFCVMVVLGVVVLVRGLVLVLLKLL